MCKSCHIFSRTQWRNCLVLLPILFLCFSSTSCLAPMILTFTCGESPLTLKLVNTHAYKCLTCLICCYYLWTHSVCVSAGGAGRVVNGAFMVLKGHRSIVNQVRFNPHTYMICSSGVEKVIKVSWFFHLSITQTLWRMNIVFCIL